MPSPSLDINSDPFDFIERVQVLPTTEAIISEMQGMLGRFGVEYFCFYFLPTPTQNLEDILLANKLPSGWLDLYRERNYLHADPSVRHCKHMLRPYRWFKEARYDPEREPEAVEVVQRALDFGLADGVVIPVASLDNRTGHMWMGGKSLDLPARNLPSLHLMALYAFERVRSLHLKVQNAAPKLTAREREVLTWIALGKSAWEVGEILRVKARTIHAHVTSARRKLNAANGVQAVAIALRDRMIQP